MITQQPNTYSFLFQFHKVVLKANKLVIVVGMNKFQFHKLLLKA